MGLKATVQGLEQIYHVGVWVGVSGKIANILTKLIAPYLAKHLRV